MSSSIQVLRRINGSPGSPTTAGAVEGTLAVNAPGVAGSTGKPSLFFYDGVAWRTVNPDVTITTQSVNLTGSAGADIGAAYATWAAAPGNTLSGSVVIATWGSPAQAYVLTNASAPGTATSWTSLGGAVSFATSVDVLTGSDTLKAINAAGLQSRLTDTPDATPANDARKIPQLGAAGQLADGFVPKANAAEVLAGTSNLKFLTPSNLQSRILATPSATPANDARKLVMLDVTGKIDSGFLKFTGIRFKSALDATVAYAAPTPGWNTGDFGVISKTGAVHASWATYLATPVPASVNAGDMVIFDGSKYHVVANDADLSAYVVKDNVNAMTAAATLSWTAPAAKTVIIDGADGSKSEIANVTINCGTY